MNLKHSINCRRWQGGQITAYKNSIILKYQDYKTDVIGVLPVLDNDNLKPEEPTEKINRQKRLNLRGKGGKGQW